MRCLFFITGMTMGGAERVMATIANEFVERGHEVTILTPKNTDSAYRLDDRVLIMGMHDQNSKLTGKMKAVLNPLRLFRRYLRVLKEYRPDIVLSFLTKTNLLAVIAKIFFQRNIPVIISERADPNGKTRSNTLKKLNRILAPKADCIVCQSSRVADYYSALSSKAEIRVIPNPINTECIALNEPENRRNTIVGVGRLAKEKNFDLLLEAFAEIREEFPDHTLEIYGSGGEKEFLENKITALGLEKRAFLMGNRSNVMHVIYDCSLYVMSSDFEGFPNALIEAMASGLPVISTDFPTGIARELITDGENGYVVPVGDKQALADKMRLILTDQKLQQKLSQNARKIAEVLDKNTIIDHWETLFQKYTVKTSEGKK